MIHYHHNRSLYTTYPVLKCTWNNLGKRVHPPPPSVESMIPRKLSQKMALEMCKNEMFTSDDLSDPTTWFVHSMLQPLQDGFENLTKDTIVAIRGEERNNSTSYWFARVIKCEEKSFLIKVQWFERVRP